MTEYYRAYDRRYKAVHDAGLQWASDTPTPIVAETVRKLGLTAQSAILELGCGEGRDAAALLRDKYNVTATDISDEAVSWCRRKYPEHAGSFKALDFLDGTLLQKFDFIYAVAVLHMLTEDPDRAAFWRFVREHLTDTGHGLVLTMGDGTVSRKSDPERAFDCVPRVHQATGRTLTVASTTCRTVDFATLRREIAGAGLVLVRDGVTSAEPEFDVMMYALVRAEKE